MALNLLETVKNYFTSDFINRASSKLGENTSGISRAITAIIPTGLAVILNKATAGPDGANRVFDMAKNHVDVVSGPINLAETENIQKGNAISSGIFEGNQSILAKSISQYAGVKDSSASSLMSMALPAIMGLLGKHAEQNNLSASGLAGFLSSQRDFIRQAIPSGLASASGILGLGSSLSAASNEASNVETVKNTTATQSTQIVYDKPKNNWLLPVIIIFAVLALLFYFSRSCNQTKPSPASNLDSTASAFHFSQQNISWVKFKKI